MNYLKKELQLTTAEILIIIIILFKTRPKKWEIRKLKALWTKPKAKSKNFLALIQLFVIF